MSPLATPLARWNAVSIVGENIGGVGVPKDGRSNHSGVLRSGKPGLPSLNRPSAPTPAFSAFVHFWTNGHVPRWTSAIEPAGMPAKSDISQPLVLLGGGPGLRLRSTAQTLAVVSTGGLPMSVPKSPPRTAPAMPGTNSWRLPGVVMLRIGAFQSASRSRS